MTDPLIYRIALTMINGVGATLARHLLQTCGDAEAVFAEKKQSLEKIPGIGSTLAAGIKHPEVLERARKEAAFIEKNGIACYFLEEETYPARLKECPDAPLLFYFKGNADLDASHIVSIVGTRNATEYGRELTEALIRDLAAAFPDLLVVSGLAYGIDVCAHKSALLHRLPTVGVLAHGLDRIYPAAHRSTAVEMAGNGGLLTDFPSETQPDRAHFIKRNRIVAGLADVTVVIESAERGGSLITADIAFSYGRDVASFPGRTTDLHSKGCNELIRQNKAALITSAADLISLMRWDVSPEKPKAPVQAELFFPENERNDLLLDIVRERKEIHLNQLARLTGLPVHKLSSLLFELEMNGKIKALPGNIYKSVL